MLCPLLSNARRGKARGRVAGSVLTIRSGVFCRRSISGTLLDPRRSRDADMNAPKFLLTLGGTSGPVLCKKNSIHDARNTKKALFEP